MPGVAADQQLAEFLDHLHQHLGAPIVKREDEVLADETRVTAHAHEDAAEAANLPSALPIGSSSGTVTAVVSMRAIFTPALQPRCA